MKRNLLILIGALVGCDAASDDVINPVNDSIPATDEWTEAHPDVREPVALTPGDGQTGKDTRRMTVDQLRRSIPALFDGITWTIPSRNAELDGFDVLAPTLGEADYLQATRNNTDPSPLFAKFMDDMAGDVCQKAVARDGGGGQAPLVVVYPDDAAQNLRFLRLKLHGVSVPDGSTEGIEDLIQLHEDILTDTNDPAAAWYGVCVAMLTAPEFLAY